MHSLLSKHLYIDTIVRPGRDSHILQVSTTEWYARVMLTSL